MLVAEGELPVEDQLFLEVREGVGEAGGHEDFVVGVGQVEPEGKDEGLSVPLGSWGGGGLATVPEVFSGGAPALVVLSAAEVGAHSSLEEGVCFFEAVEVEPDCAGLLVFEAEEEPLAVALGVGVHPQVQVVLAVGHLLTKAVLRWPGSGCRPRTGCQTQSRASCECPASSPESSPSPPPAASACSGPKSEE